MSDDELACIFQFGDVQVVGGNGHGNVQGEASAWAGVSTTVAQRPRFESGVAQRPEQAKHKSGPDTSSLTRVLVWKVL